MMTKYICLLCQGDGVDDPFISEDCRDVGQHINDDHEQNDINDFVCFYGAGCGVLKEEEEKVNGKD